MEGVTTQVDRDGPARYILPPDVHDVRGAMMISLGLLEVSAPQVSYLTWALPWRAVLCEWLPCPFLVHWLGPTGERKSSLAAAMLAHFDTFRTKDDLPARWEFTDNILERVLSGQGYGVCHRRFQP